MHPWVSVVIPVHNSLPYLEDTLASVFHQSVDRERVEVIAVDDGSTDDSPRTLAAWAARWPQLQVITQAASGTAGRPRNVGIERATGDYLFFLDSDDCLGPEALERLLGFAREHDSDVVLAKLVGIGRSVPRTVFQEDLPRAGLRSGVYYTLMPFKLVRRSLVMDHDIRFPEHMRISEDQRFVAACYLAADVISVLGSYPAYYLMRREDGSNLSKGGLPYADVVRQADETVRMVVEQTSPGADQAHLVGRHIRIELLHRIQHVLLDLPPEEQAELVRTAAPYARAWRVEGLDTELTVSERLICAALGREDLDRVVRLVRWWVHGQRSPAVHDGGRWFLAAPGFRESDAYPDELFTMKEPPDAATATWQVGLEGRTLSISGHGYIKGIPSADCEIAVTLIQVDSDREVELDVDRTPTPFLNAVEGGGPVSYAEAGFRARGDLDAESLGSGRWRLVVRITAPHLTQHRNLLPPAGFEPTKSSWESDDGTRRTAVLRVGSKDNLVVGLKSTQAATVIPGTPTRRWIPRRPGRSGP